MASTRSDIVFAGVDEDSRARVEKAWESGSPFLLATPGRGFDDGQLDLAASRMLELPSTSFGLLTSGSTGRPKLIIGTRERASALASAISAAQRLDDVAATVSVLPLGYSYAFVNQWVWAANARRKFIPVPTGVTGLREAIAALRDVHLCLVGAQVPALLRDPWASDAVSRVCFAGGPFPSEHMDGLRRTFPRAQFFNNYGCTEAMPRLCVRPIGVDEVPPSNAVGTPLSGIELRQIDGTIEFRSPYRAIGTIVDDEFHEWQADAWIATGDLGEFIDGEWRLLGRHDDVFKRYGERIALGELRAHFGTEGLAVDLLPERDRREEPGYRLVLRRESDLAVVKRLLRGWRRARWPNAIDVLDDRPVNLHGKTAREALAGGRTIWTNE
jgi:acyl-CoA synthetase (AMP-forming)/AMP-acid ligase II